MVDPDVSWDDIRPKPIRNPAVSTKLTGVSRPGDRQQASQPVVVSQPAMTHRVINDQEIPMDTQPPLNHATLVSQDSTATVQPPDTTAYTQPERSRTYLPRAVKRRLDPPPLVDQKKARINAIRCVALHCK